MSATVRPAAVAGTFYPGDPVELRGMVDRLLHEATDAQAPGAPIKAVIAPHAGYIYSGPVAASAYALVATQTTAIEKVVLLGPAHRVALRGMAVPSVDAFATPLGEIEIDPALRLAALRCRNVAEDDRPHVLEHSLEVHLPFLQRAVRAPGWRLLPVLVGRCGPDEVAALLDVVWGGPETLIVISTDLSHYLTYDEAVRIDRHTAAVIAARDIVALEPEQACGAYPVRGLLELALRRDLEIDLLDLRNSADTAGTPDRVVGYGAFAVREPA